MWKDAIVEETRQAREEHAAKFNYDLEAICRDLERQAAETKRKVVSLRAKEPELVPQAKAS